MTLFSIKESEDFLLAEQFITPHEETCVFLASHIRRHQEKLFFILKTEGTKGTDPSSSSSPNKKEILGLIYLDSSLFHCIPNPNLINGEELARLIKLNQKHKIKCISGEAQTSEFLLRALIPNLGLPYQTNHYKLMTIEKVQSPNQELSNDDQIIRCTEDDMERLFPIQKQYLKEEVAPFGKTVTDAEVSIGLRQTLKNQLCLALCSDGEYVAKANTNAIGINWIQLGGIYTSPLYRRNGYAWQLISAICRRTGKAGKKAALFVKDINIPAIELYKKLGFRDSGLYEIAYF